MPAKRTDVSAVSVLSELERLEWDYISLGDDELKLKCPAHEDADPSAALNAETGKWVCYACGAKGDIAAFIAFATNVSRTAAIQDLSTRYDLEGVKSISPDSIEKMHAGIWDSGPLLSALRQRGVTDDMIRDARLGAFRGRVTIPVKDHLGRYINIRRYLPGAPSADKMRNTRGYSRAALYRIEDLKYEKVLVLGGEVKALVAGGLLNALDIGAVAGTGGENTWKSDWNTLFQDKIVWVCMDIDKAGVTAALKVAHQLVTHAKEVYVVSLPLDVERYPKGDINDYVGCEKADANDLVRLLEASPLFKPGQSPTEELLPTKEVVLHRVAEPANVRGRVRTAAVVSILDTTPYLVPSKVSLSCTRDQPFCHICPLAGMRGDDDGWSELSVPSTSVEILEMVGGGRITQKQNVLASLSIPTCKVVELRVNEHFSVVDAHLSPEIDVSSDVRATVSQHALFVDVDPEMNTPYIVEGRVMPHPRTQQAVLVLDELEQTEGSLQRFKPTKDELEAVASACRAEPGLKGIRAKVDELMLDLAHNVTGIYGRDRLHLALDLAYHSPLMFDVRGRLTNGWLNLLIVGDSAQGKTEASSRLREWYGLGERTECKNATVAGLLGGLNQVGNRWYVQWGVIPTFDGQLVILEEVKGASVEVLAKLTDARSSGIAEIPKIERRKTHARTRLIFISNPRSTRGLASYSFGVEALHELIGSLEDLRRFDLAVILAAGEVDPEIAGRGPRPLNKLTREIGKRCVLWAWTRKREHINMPEETIVAALDHAKKLLEKYTETFPLVDSGTMNLKLLRLAAGLAARTFSTKDLETLDVLPEHVEFCAQFIDTEYSSPCFGFDTYAASRQLLSTVVDEGRIIEYLNQTRHPADVIRGLLCRDDIVLGDLQDLCELDRDRAQSVLSFLVRMHALARTTRAGYSKTADFIAVLRRAQITAPQTAQDINEF